MAFQDQGIYSFEECVPEGSDYLQQTLGIVHTRISSTHNKRREEGETEYQALIIQRRSLK